ncbi:uncharacterized protein [Battus philenor]|uniref:uncharacterized protein n=1 Tax=Battus philenor TaxID=42288 RepID=UPI0035D0253D
MEKFQFSSTGGTTNRKIVPFSGRVFFGVYKEAEFLRHSDNIETILSKGYELRQKLKNVKPGQYVKIDGIWLEKNTPLLVKKTGPNVEVDDYEFTANRLSGLVAAYAFENRHRFPIVNSSEAISLGLKWDNDSIEKCKLYLSAVSGTEHFYDQFTYWPLICALRKLYLKKITLEPVLKVAKIKNSDGLIMAHDLMNNRATVHRLWLHFPGTTSIDLKSLLETAPEPLAKILKTF